MEGHEMKEAVVVAACRTAVGRAPGGTLKDTRPFEQISQNGTTHVLGAGIF